MLAQYKRIQEHNPKLNLRQVEGIINILCNNDGVSSSILIKTTGLPKETLRAFKISIAQYLEYSKIDSLKLTSDATQLFKNARAFEWSLWTKLDAEVVKYVTEVRKKYFQCIAKRDYDQFYATPETSSKKISLLKTLGFLEGQRVALLGDDDLVSVGLQQGTETNVPVDVFEIDPDLLAGLSSYKSDTSKSINVYQTDLRKGIDPRSLGKYSVVITDPPYTKHGIALFLTRALELLLPVTKSEEDKYIILFYGNSYKTPEKTLKIQEMILQMGLVIENKINNFANYNGAESIGSSSSVYVLRVTDKAVVRRDLLVSDSIYTFEDQKEEKFPFVDHLVFKLHQVDRNFLLSKKALYSTLGKFCEQHKLKVKSSDITEFKGGGMTLTYILYNSNLVAHTWPEYSALHVDLITCTPIYKKDLCLKTLANLFKTQNIDLKFVE